MVRLPYIQNFVTLQSVTRSRIVERCTKISPKNWKEKTFSFSHFESLNSSRTLFIYEGEKNCNFYFRGLFFKHLRGALQRFFLLFGTILGCREENSKVENKSHPNVHTYVYQFRVRSMLVCHW